MQLSRRTRLSRCVALATIGVLLAGGCSLNDKEEAVQPAVAVHSGGTPRVAIGRPGSIDPNNAYEPNGELVVRTLCDQLLQQDPRTGELRGDLVDSFQTTDGGSKFVVRLRKDLRFSNGRNLTADDIAASLA